MDFHQNTQPEAHNEQHPAQNQQSPENPAAINQTAGNPIPDEPHSVQSQTEHQESAAVTGQIPNQETNMQGALPSGNPSHNNQYNNMGNNPYDHNPYRNNGHAVPDKTVSPYQNQQPGRDNTGTPYPNNQPSQNGNPYQNGTPYQNSNLYQNGNPHPNGNPYQNNNPYQNSGTYNNNSYSYTNNDSVNNTGYPNGYNNGYPYYGKNAYQLPYTEPGSNLANAAMVLGIIAIISCITFTIYPAFIFGSIAIILALLSKGRQSKLQSKARTGIICATIGLIVNTVLVTFCISLLFTNPDVREEVNQTFEEQYGMSFDEMMEEIMENNGISY